MGLNHYRAVPSAGQHLTVDSYGGLCGEVSGSFAFTAVAERPPRNGEPDTVRCQGTFRTRVMEQFKSFDECR